MDKTTTALEESEERLQRALDATGLCLWDFDVVSGDVFLSESWSSRLGGPHAATHTTFAALAGLVPEEERPALMDALIEALKSDGVDYRVEHRVRRVDGSYLWNLGEGKVVARDALGRAVRMVGTNRDITANKQAQALLANLEAQLRESQKMEAIGTFAAGIAHDFNNILGAVLGNLALARDDVGTGHPAQRCLDQIEKAALRARTLVRQILLFGRHEPQQLVNRSLRPIVEESIDLLRASLPVSAALRTEYGEQPMRALIDTTQIQQVIFNLCTNAWHALPNGRGTIVVSVSRRERSISADTPSSNFVVLCVRDDGCGMDDATLQRIFDPFFTTKQVGQGTGLGLSVVHGIVSAHGGTIDVESSLGNGSVFRICLPVAPEHDPEALSGWDELTSLRRMGQGERVLYVDDDDVMGLLAERLLTRMGYKVTYCQDPTQAVNTFREQPNEFDLVISDYNMPKMSGLALAKSLRALRPDLPVVITSGHLSDDDRRALSMAGVRAFVRKENTLEELGPTAEQLLSALAIQRESSMATLAEPW